MFVKISVRSLSTVGLRGMFWWQCSIAIKKRTNSEPNVPSRRDGENCKRRSSTTLRNITLLGLYLKYDAPHNTCYPDFVMVTVTTKSWTTIKSHASFSYSHNLVTKLVYKLLRSFRNCFILVSFCLYFSLLSYFVYIFLTWVVTWQVFSKIEIKIKTKIS